MFLSCIDKWCESRLVMVVSWVLSRVSPCLSPCFHGFLFLVIYSHSGLWLTDGILLTVLVTLNLQHLLRVKTSQRGSVSCGRGWPVWVCWELWQWLTNVSLLWAVAVADQCGSVSCGHGWCGNCVKERNGKRRPFLFLQCRAEDCRLLSVEVSGFLLACGIDHPKCWF